MENTFTIGLVQTTCGWNIADNVEHTASLVENAAARGAQIICLQELFNTPYLCTVEDNERFDYAEIIPGPTTEKMQQLAKKLSVVLVVPFFEKRAPGLYHNSAAVIDADGALLGVYRKMHIPDDPLYYEKFYFTPGDAEGENCGFRVFKTRYATIGVLICWDQWYPEGARITSLLGAEVLFYPTAIGWHPAEKATEGKSQFEAWQTIQRGHAIANGVYVASANRFGHEETPGTEGIEFFGQSFVSDPFGRVIEQAPSDKEAVLVAECTRKTIENTRRCWPFLRDRRVDAYRPILARYLDNAEPNKKREQ